MIFRRKPKTVASTPISDFIRHASAAEKKRVYKVVLEKAAESQRQIQRQAAQQRARAGDVDKH